MRANKPSPLDKKAELLKNKKEKEKAEESEEEDDEDDEMDDKNQKSKQPATKSTLNKDIKPAVTKKEEIKPKPVSQIPTGVYKSKLVTNQKQEINKPKENITSTNTSGGNSIRRNILEKKSQVPAKPTTNTNTIPLSQNKNQIYQTQQTQPKAQPLQKPPVQQNQTHPQTQPQTQSRYIRKPVEQKETVSNKNDNNNNNEINKNEVQEKPITSNNTNNNKEIEHKNLKTEDFNKKEKRYDINKEEVKKEVRDKDNSINVKESNNTKEEKAKEGILKIELPEGKKDYVTEDIMRQNGIEIVKISLEDQNKLLEKKAETEELKN